MPEPERYPLGIDELLAFAARNGVKAMRHQVRREVALLARVIDRDAPIIAAASSDKRWVMFRMRLPLRVAEVGVAALNARGGPFVWTHDAARAALTVSAPAFIVGVLYSDTGLGTLLTGLRDAADREARSLRQG